jgi:2,7-dihydroxy-5-methyl-1-naphthoate 7-O-methyltransferase
VVVGGVSPDPAPSGLVVEMVLVGGKERSLERFSLLAAAAELTVELAGHLPSGRFAVECRPV